MGLMVSQVFYVNSDKIPSVAQDYIDIQARVENHSKQPKNHDPNHESSLFFCALESIPTLRRTSSLSDKAENGEYASIAGILGLTLVNIKEDWRDVVSAAKQIYSKINPNYHYDPLYNRHDFQHGFSFTKGLIGEEYMYKKIEEGNKIAQKVRELDVTIDDTALGKLIINNLQVKKEEIKTIDGIKNAVGCRARAYKFSSKVFGGAMTTRAMKRTTVAGVLVAAAVELPKVFSEATKGDNFFEQGENFAKQIVKSSVNVVSATAGIAYGGAIGAKYGGAAGSIIGMGVGAVLGSKVSNKIQGVI